MLELVRAVDKAYTKFSPAWRIYHDGDRCCAVVAVYRLYKQKIDKNSVMEEYVRCKFNLTLEEICDFMAGWDDRVYGEITDAWKIGRELGKKYGLEEK